MYWLPTIDERLVKFGVMLGDNREEGRTGIAGCSW